MNAFTEHIARWVAALCRSAAEVAWPTRCAVCEQPGQLLCDRCRRSLGYVDPLRACPRCGAPYGRVQCSECNGFTLARRGLASYPLDGQASAVAFDDAASRIVRTWKDAGERELAQVMGELMAACVPPEWVRQHPVVVPVPASARALRSRGFDHGHELSLALAERLGLPCQDLFERPQAKDQRKLTGSQRAQNMQGGFRLRARGPCSPLPGTVLLADDVCTTGATLFSAAEALRSAGVRRVYAVTFARVW